MPLIRGIKNWFDRRLAGAAMSGALPADVLVVFVVLLPIIAVLALIGLIYELVIRIDQRRLGSTVEWGLSSVAAAALLVGLYVVFVLR